jgi:hypothetical protein
MTKNMKRIHSISIKRFYAVDDDTSWLGEYASSPTSEFSIDRQHALDCPAQTYNKPTEAIDLLERVMMHIRNVKDAHCSTIKNRTDEEKAADLDIWTNYDDAEDVCIYASERLEECDCGKQGDMEHGQYRYFNPSFNYVDKHGKAWPGNTPEEIRKCVLQDYERMEGLNCGAWHFLGIRAEAKISLGVSQHDLIQEITSEGLFGIESDSDASYFTEVEQEELAELRQQLRAVGFSQRAISAAFKNVQRKDE